MYPTQSGQNIHYCFVSVAVTFNQMQQSIAAFQNVKIKNANSVKS